MKTPLFSGTGVALITPFRKQQETVDFTKLESLIENIVNSGVDYIVALGTTSEAEHDGEPSGDGFDDEFLDGSAFAVGHGGGFGGGAECDDVVDA